MSRSPAPRARKNPRNTAGVFVGFLRARMLGARLMCSVRITRTDSSDFRRPPRPLRSTCTNTSRTASNRTSARKPWKRGLDPEASIAGENVLDDLSGGRRESSLRVRYVQPLPQHGMDTERGEIGEQRAVQRLLSRYEQSLPGLGPVGEHEHEPPVHVTSDAAEHRPRQERRLCRQRIDKRPEAMTGQRVARVTSASPCLQAHRNSPSVKDPDGGTVAAQRMACGPSSVRARTGKPRRRMLARGSPQVPAARSASLTDTSPRSGPHTSGSRTFALL